MKKMLFVLGFCLAFSLAAQAGDPVAQITFRVADDFGSIITNAPVSISTFKKKRGQPMNLRIKSFVREK